MLAENVTGFIPHSIAGGAIRGKGKSIVRVYKRSIYAFRTKPMLPRVLCVKKNFCTSITISALFIKLIIA